VKSLQALPEAVRQIARRGDLVITLGAGSIGTVPDRILEALQADSSVDALSPSKAEGDASERHPRSKAGGEGA
jgi:hypothetical protein